MGNILNFVFAEKNKSNIVDGYRVNGHDRPEFQLSALFNWLMSSTEYRTGPDNLGSVSFTTDYQINKDSKNIFLLECQSSLRDLWGDKGIYNDGIFNDFPNEFKELIRSGQVKILTGCISEGTPDLNKFEIDVQYFCKINNIPLDSLIFIDNNKQIEKCKKIIWYYVPHFIYDGANTAKHLLSGEGVEKNDLNYVSTLPTNSEAKNKLDREYYFMSLNRSNDKIHRTVLGCYFIEKNDNRILWSFLSSPRIDFPERFPKFKKLHFDNIENLKKIVPKMVILPEVKQLDTYSEEFLGDFGTEDTFDKNTSLSYYFDIVTETQFEDLDNIFFSEKIMKPLINLHPFIVISSGGYLRELRSLGFKTYDGLFDESYDEIIDRWERLGFIFGEIDRILLKSPEEIKDLYRKYSDICIYNRDHLLKNFYVGGSKHFNSTFTDKVAGL
jgi:hypothetical protein